MKTIIQLFQRFREADAFAPITFVGRAIIIAILYAVSCLAGLEEYTAFLSGTSAVGLGWKTAATLGLIHLLLHFGFILLVPIFLITAGLLTAWNWCMERV